MKRFLLVVALLLVAGVAQAQYPYNQVPQGYQYYPGGTGFNTWQTPYGRGSATWFSSGTGFYDSYSPWTGRQSGVYFRAVPSAPPPVYNYNFYPRNVWGW